MFSWFKTKLPPPARLRCSQCDAEMHDTVYFCPQCGHIRSPSDLRQVTHARALGAATDALREAKLTFLTVTAVFLLSCWAPMFLVDTPAWCSWTELVLVLILGYCSSKLGLLNFNAATHHTKQNWDALRGMCRVTIVACVAVFAIMAIGPGWSGPQWLFPGSRSHPDRQL
jgi:hypothetical protein